jgi:hypothetical protein
VIVLAIFAIGCGGAGAHRSTVPTPTAIEGATISSLLPADTFSIAFVDLASLRRTALYGAIHESLEAWSDSFARMGAEVPGPAAETAGAPPPGAAEREPPSPPEGFSDILALAEWFVLAQAGTADDTSDIAIVGGRFERSQIERYTLWTAESWLEELPMVGELTGSDEEAEPPPASERAPIALGRSTIAGREAIVAGDVAAVELTTHVWVIASPRRIEEIAGRAARSARSEARTAELEDALSIYSHQLAWVCADFRVVEEAVAIEGEAEPAWLSSVEAGGFWLDLDDGLEAAGYLEHTRGIDSRRALREMRRSIREWRETSFVRLFGLARVLDAIDARLDGSRIELALELDPLEAHLLWGRVSGAVGAGLFVAELLMGVFRGIGEAMEGLDLPGDVPDYTGADVDRSGRIIDFTVDEASPGAPASAGEACVLEVEPAQDPAASLCHHRVTCGSRTLYDSTTPCTLGDSQTLSVIASDSTMSDIDGTPAFTVTTPASVVEIADDRAGSTPYTVRGTITSVR